MVFNIASSSLVILKQGNVVDIIMCGLSSTSLAIACLFVLCCVHFSYCTRLYISILLSIMFLTDIVYSSTVIYYYSQNMTIDIILYIFSISYIAVSCVTYFLYCFSKEKEDN